MSTHPTDPQVSIVRRFGDVTRHAGDSSTLTHALCYRLG